MTVGGDEMKKKRERGEKNKERGENKDTEMRAVACIRAVIGDIRGGTMVER